MATRSSGHHQPAASSAPSSNRPSPLSAPSHQVLSSPLTSAATPISMALQPDPSTSPRIQALPSPKQAPLGPLPPSAILPPIPPQLARSGSAPTSAFSRVPILEQPSSRSLRRSPMCSRLLWVLGLVPPGWCMPSARGRLGISCTRARIWVLHGQISRVLRAWGQSLAASWPVVPTRLVWCMSAPMDGVSSTLRGLWLVEAEAA